MPKNEKKTGSLVSQTLSTTSSALPVILVVDDDAAMRVLLGHLLKNQGYTIQEARDGLESVALFKESPPDLVLLDAMMPNMDGFTACRKIRSLPGGERVPILMVTALNDPESVNKAFDAGADDYIIKPVNRAVLRQRMKYLLRARQAEAALSRSQARYQSLFEQAPISLWEEDFSAVKRYLDQLQVDEAIDDFAAYLDEHPAVVQHCAELIKVLDVNHLTLEVYRAASREELLRHLPHVFGPASHDILKAELLTLSKGDTVFEGEGINYTLAGERINVKVRWAVAHGYEETLERVLVSIVDVTEQRRVEETLLAAQKLADLGTLAAGVAHEMNSPLQVITGVSQSLQRRMQNGDVSQDYMCKRLDVIHRNGWRCAEIVRSLKTYAYSAATETDHHNINNLITDALLLIEHQLKSWSHVNITTNFAADLPLLACDRNQISQILINLLSNARDAMPDGGDIIIQTDYNVEVGQLILKVADNGLGIPADTQTKIFDPFFTTKPVGEGTGLGLSIIHGILQSYGGTIEVDSVVGQGTTFSMLFPVDNGDTAAVQPRGNPVGRFDN